MNNYSFLWCRYRVKNCQWIKIVCTLTSNSTKRSNDNEFTQSNLHAFLWRTSTLFVTSSLTTQIVYELCWKRIIDRNYARMCTETHKALSKLNLVFCSNFQIITVAFSYLVSVVCCCLLWFNVAFNNGSVISRRCLVATGSSMLTFIVLPHWSIMPQTLDSIPHPVTLSWHMVDQS